MRKVVILLLGMIMLAALTLPAFAQRGGNRREVTLPKGPEKKVILESCTTCHGLDIYATKALDREGWQKVVDAMKTKGAVISDPNASILLDYLVSTFGPGSLPAPVAALPPLEPALEAKAKQLLQDGCTSCHNLQRVEAQSQTLEGWQGIVENMINRGASLKEADAPLVVDYLVRAFGPK